MPAMPLMQSPLSSGGPEWDQIRSARRLSLKNRVMIAVPIASSPMTARALTHQGPARMSLIRYVVRVWMDGLGKVDAREELMMVGAEYTRRSVARDLVDACDRDLAHPLVRRSIQNVVEWQAYTSVVRVAPG